MVVLGIDTDSLGSLALLDTIAATLDVYRVPKLSETMTTGITRSCINLSVLSAILAELICNVDVAFLERQWGRKDEVAGRAFGFGRIYGSLCGCTAVAFHYAGKKPDEVMHYVPAQTWKHKMRLDADKDKAVALAQAIFPACKHGFEGPRGGKIISAAEASLIAFYGASQMGVKFAPGVAFRPRAQSYATCVPSLMVRTIGEKK